MNQPDHDLEKYILTTWQSNIAMGNSVGGNLIQITINHHQPHNVKGLPNPYLGLRSFEYKDRGKFAGRTRYIESAIKQLTNPGNQQNVLFITGASGSGKSSLAQAGIIPALKEHYKARSCIVKHAVFRPGKSPLAALADAYSLLQLNISTNEKEVAAFIKMINVEQDKRFRYVIIIDQFEELFTQSDPGEKIKLFDFLKQISLNPNLQINIIATLRADYLSELHLHLKAHQSLYEIIINQGITLWEMDEKELQESIEQPLKDLQISYIATLQNSITKLDPSIQKSILDLNIFIKIISAVQGKYFECDLIKRLVAAANPDATLLPLLQVTLEDIWQQGLLTAGSYTTLTNAIEKRADLVYKFRDYDGERNQRRSKDDQAAIMQLFIDLVKVLDDNPRHDVRRRRTIEDLCGDSATRRRLMDELVTARLLSTTVETQDTGKVEVVDIIHETLLLNWKRLRQAVVDQRSLLEQRQRFEQSLSKYMRQADYLLAGVDLAEAEILSKAKDIAVRDENAKELVQRSVAKREADLHEKLAQAQALAEEQRQRADAEQKIAQEQRQRADAEKKERLAANRAKRSWRIATIIFGVLTLVVIFPLIRNEGRRIYAKWYLSPITPIAASTGAVTFTDSVTDSSITIRQMPRFGIDTHEVSNEQYCLCTKTGNCPIAPIYIQGDVCDESYAQFPVNNVTVRQASDYCTWIGRRLPTELEWEWAARGKPNRVYPTEKNPPDIENINIERDKSSSLWPINVQRHDVTPDGVLGMVGNVSEWTHSWYVPYSNTLSFTFWPQQIDPSIEIPTQNWVAVRGGSMGEGLDVALSTTRNAYRADDTYPFLGFRCIEGLTLQQFTAVAQP